MWRCSRCETDNSETDILCNGCDWHSPNLVSFDAKLIEKNETPTYAIQWDFDNSLNLTVDNGIGEVSPTGKTTISIKEKTKLVFSVKNEHAEKEFSQILFLPVPIIESFVSSETTIRLGKPILLSWSVKYADTIALSDFGNVIGTNQKEVLLSKTSSLVLNAENASGKREETIRFHLPLPQITAFDSNYIKAIAGDEITLSWHVDNAESISLAGLGKDETLKGSQTTITLDKSTNLTLKVTNATGTVTKNLSIEIIPKPAIVYFKIDRSVALINDDVEVSWETVNCSKHFLLIDEIRYDVSDMTSYNLGADKSMDVKLVCESIDGLKIISEYVSLKVIERVSIDRFRPSSLYTLQSKPILLSWSISHATEITLLPLEKKIAAEGTLSLLPSEKTIYRIEAKNELSSETEEVEIDVLPLPRISNIKIVNPPEIQLPSSFDITLKYPSIEKTTVRYLALLKDYFIRKLTPEMPKSLNTTFISFTQQSEHVQVTRKSSLMGIVNVFKSITNSSVHLENFKRIK